MAKKDWGKVIEAAIEQGWRSETTRDGLQLFAPGRVGIVTIHGTPSDPRAIKNAISRLRRHGFQWPPKR